MSNRELKTGGRSCCGDRQRQQKMIALPGCSGDDVAVATLPDDWVPRRAGPILSNYLKERELNHEQILGHITKEATDINKNIDLKVRTLAEALLTHINQKEKDITCAVKKFGSRSDIPTQNRQNEVLTHIRQLYSQSITDLSTFKRDALNLEKERAEEIKKILQKQFQHLVTVGHNPPRDLLHMFDQQVYEINQQLLSNFRAYAELEAQLRAQLDEKAVEAKSNINQIVLGFCIEGQRRSTYPWLREEKVTKRRSTSLDSKAGIVKNTVSKIMGEAQEFDECVSLLVQAYRTAVIKILSGFMGKLSDLHSHLGSPSFIEKEPQKLLCERVVDLQSIIDRVLKRMSDCLGTSLSASSEMARSDILEMQKSLWALGDRLRDTYTILHDSAHLWDAHMVRSALAQKLTIACVEDLCTSNDAIELVNEVNFSIALEQLRSASDPDKLQQQYDAILVMLDRTADIYGQHSASENGRLESFMNFPDYMANVLMSEFHCFLEKFPRSSIPISDTGLRQPSEISLNSTRLNVNSLQLPLPRAILQTELQGLYLLNWRNGFLETFANNLSNLREELRLHARIWVDEKALALQMRHTLKLISLSVRKERVKAAYELRLAELKYHDARLESHLSAVYELVDSLPSDAAEFLSLDAPELYPLCEWVDRIQNSIDELLSQDPVDPEVKKLRMSSYALRLEKHRTLFENSLDVAIGIGKKQMENRIQEARISNVRFASHIKLLSEGGRYSAQEATRTSASLMKGADAIESCLSRTVDILNHRRSQILVLAEQKLHHLQKIVGEFAKSAKGAAADKRKPTPGKKK